MTHRFLAGALLAAAFAASPASSAEAGSRKSLVLGGAFRFLSEAPIERIHGTAEGARGVIVIDLSDLTKTSGEISVPVAELKTGSPIRDEHLRGESWLAGDSHPRLNFVIRDVSGVSTKQEGEILVATGTVRGDFTMRGVTKPLSSTFTLKMKGARAKVELSFEVALAAYDIKGRDGVIGSKVGEKIALSGRLVGSVKDEP